MDDRRSEMLRHHLRKALENGTAGQDQEAGLEMSQFALSTLEEAIHQCENLDSIAQSLKKIAEALDGIGHNVASINS